MQNNFHLGLLEDNGKRVVDFTNNTGNFVEVVLEIDGQVVKGYCYPPFHHKPIRRLRSGESLPFARSGRVRAYVYAGTGSYSQANACRGNYKSNYKDNVDDELPPFIRRKLNHQENFNTDQILQERLKRKVTFHRTNSNPIQILEVPY